MKVQLTTYQHAANGVAIQLLPETDIEADLLRGVWKHGKLETGHPCSGMGDTGFYIKAYQNTDQPTPRSEA